MINLARGHHLIDAAVRRGEWTKIEGVSLHGEVLGVIGAGSIGRAVMRRGIGFGMSVLIYDPFLQAGCPRVRGGRPSEAAQRVTVRGADRARDP